jgi:hypothetical protein
MERTVMVSSIAIAMLIISRAEGQRKYQLGNKILNQHLKFKKCDENLRIILTYTTMFNLGDNLK